MVGLCCESLLGRSVTGAKGGGFGCEFGMRTRMGGEVSLGGIRGGEKRRKVCT
jgi:hypothetical protein